MSTVDPQRFVGRVPSEFVPIVAAMKAARQRLGLSQRQLASLCGVAQPCISNIERGWTVPSPMLLDLMKKTLGMEDSRGSDFQEERNAYLATKRPVLVGTPRWALKQVKEAISVQVDTNTDIVTYLLGLDGDPKILEDNFEEICAGTEFFITALCTASGWTREEVGVSAKAMVEFSTEKALWDLESAMKAVRVEVTGSTTPPEAQPPVEPTWVYEPYVAPEAAVEVPPPPPSTQTKLRAVVMSTNNPVEFDRVYGQKLSEVVGVEVVKVVNPDRTIETDISSVDLVVACKDRMSHSQWYAIQSWARRCGKRLVTIGRHSSSWLVAFGMMGVASTLEMFLTRTPKSLVTP
jgi:transcriptional regulator with XRE-family HTH domain